MKEKELAAMPRYRVTMSGIFDIVFRFIARNPSVALTFARGTLAHYFKPPTAKKFTRYRIEEKSGFAGNYNLVDEGELCRGEL
ncbi:MAG: hypothetical protein FWF63_07300 [Fibromonadales bacterium]|nr:hypothetical protein [Fibromonadales bacterium]